MTENIAHTQTRQPLSPLKLAGVYIGTVVGAGFASGQEVLQFFGFHGVNGIWGILLSTVLFVGYGVIVLILGHRLNATSHLQVVRTAGPWVGTVIDAIITFFLLGAFTAMAAGSGAVFQEQLGIPAVWGSLVMVIISVITVLLGIHGVLSAIGFVAPILVASVLTVSLFTLLRAPVNWTWFRPQEAAIPYWPLSAATYASYNIVLAIAVLAPTGSLAGEATLRQGALLGGVGLGLGAMAIQLAMLTHVPRVAAFQIPMLFLARQILAGIAPFYSAVLLAEVYTTAAGSLYGFVARLTDPAGPRFPLITIGSGIAGFLGSFTGFSQLVAKLYSAVGYAGFILLVALIVAYWRSEQGPVSGTA